MRSWFKIKKRPHPLLEKMREKASIDYEKTFLKDIFCEVAANYAETIDCMNNLVLTSAEELLYTSPQAQINIKNHAEGKGITEAAVKEQIIKNAKKYFEDNAVVSASYAPVCLSVKNPVKIISSSLLFLKFTHVANPAEILFREVFGLDHEAGHAICGYSRFNDIESENIADAFATLMHAKRFNTNSDFIKEQAYENASYALFSKTLRELKYYTSASILAAETVAKNIDIDKASVEDVAWYATKIGLYYAPKEEVLEIMSTKAEKILSISKQVLSFADRAKLVSNIMLENKEDEDLYRAGKLYLSRKPVRSNIKTEDPFWQTTLKAMDSHEKTTGFILNLVEKDDLTTYKKYLKETSTKEGTLAATVLKNLSPFHSFLKRCRAEEEDKKRDYSKDLHL